MRFLRFSVACTILLIASAASASPNGCTLRNAFYTSPVSHLRLSFVHVGHQQDLVSDLALHIVEPRSRKQFWYYFDEGSAPQVSLISTSDATKRGWQPNSDGGVRPYGSATLIGLRKDGRILQEPPSSKSSAPKYIIIPELAEVFKGIRLWGVDANAFVLTSCRSGPNRP